jgi:glyoxylase-like metal-dependent hydrolase (beta-lactamase superfamily II)
VDTGVPKSEGKILKYLESLKIKISEIGLIVVTHGHIDHFGSAAELKTILNAPILIHKSDLNALETGKTLAETLKPNKLYWNILKRKVLKDSATSCHADIILNGENEFSLLDWKVDGKIIPTPGHTPGSLSIVLDNKESIIMDLASSGILLGGIAFNSRMKHPPFHDDLEQVKDSINKILKTNSQKFYLGHGNAINRKSLEDYRDKFLP